jgi:DNA modification methylase
MLEPLPWKTVVDPFCGTGAVIIACQNTDRRCVGVEIDPKTAAVALQRCQDAGLPAPKMEKSVQVVDS